MQFLQLRVHQSGLDKAEKQRMWPVRAALELRVELTAHKPGMIGKLYNFHQSAVRGKAGQPQALFRQDLAKLVVEFIAMPMPLRYLPCPV